MKSSRILGLTCGALMILTAVSCNGENKKKKHKLKNSGTTINKPALKDLDKSIPGLPDGALMPEKAEIREFVNDYLDKSVLCDARVATAVEYDLDVKLKNLDGELDVIKYKVKDLKKGLVLAENQAREVELKLVDEYVKGEKKRMLRLSTYDLTDDRRLLSRIHGDLSADKLIMVNNVNDEIAVAGCMHGKERSQAAHEGAEQIARTNLAHDNIIQEGELTCAIDITVDKRKVDQRKKDKYKERALNNSNQIKLYSSVDRIIFDLNQVGKKHKIKRFKGYGAYLTNNVNSAMITIGRGLVDFNWKPPFIDIKKQAIGIMQIDLENGSRKKMYVQLDKSKFDGMEEERNSEITLDCTFKKLEPRKDRRWIQTN